MIKKIALLLVTFFLPWNAANAAVVDINANVNYLGNPLNIFLSAGTYSVTNIGTSNGGLYDGWSPWSFTSCTAVAGCPLTSPTTTTGFRNSYNVISPNISAVSVGGTALVPVSTAPTDVSVFADFFAAGDRYHVDDTTLYSTALLASLHARTSFFTLDVAGMVGFAINDILPLTDNRGGISLLISPIAVVPLPAALPLLGSALVGFGLFGWRQKRRVST